MRILIDICHPAHFHFFKNPIMALKEKGHEVLVVSRNKEVTLALLDAAGLENVQLTQRIGKGIIGLAKELLIRNYHLFKLAKAFKPDVMAAIGGIFIAQVGFVSRVPSVVFYDTENAKLQNLMTYPLASLVVVPNCYESWVPEAHVEYQGYHELSYLHPRWFTPNHEIALANGLATNGQTFVLRVVSWNANHDINEKGWSLDLLRKVADYLGEKGKVIISSESELPQYLSHLSYIGNPAELHHVLAFSALFVGESATMASESVVLGVPAIYAAHTGRGYCNEQERRYGMLKNVKDLTFEPLRVAMEEQLGLSSDELKARWSRMLGESVDVTEYAARLIEQVGAGELVAALRAPL